MNPELLTQIKANCEWQEGRVHWFYLDKPMPGRAANVTIGIGHLVATLKDALLLPLNPFDAIRTDYMNVQNALPGLLARVYQDLSKSRMTDAAIDALLDSDLAGCMNGIRDRTLIFDKAPESVRGALTDMGINLGVAGLFKYHELWVAAAVGDWAKAANESGRRGISLARNAWTAEQFRKGLYV